MISAKHLPLLRRIVQSAPCVLLLAALGAGVVGCTSIYHRAQAELPPNPAAELQLRIAAAQKAETATRQAAERLVTRLEKDPDNDLRKSDSDRLEVAAYDLERRVLTAREAAEQHGRPEIAAAEIERLTRQATAWLDFVHDRGDASRETQIRTLRLLLNPAGR